MNSTDKVILRSDVSIEPLSMEHGVNMFRWMRDPSVSRNLGLRQEPSLEKTQNWIANMLQDSTMHGYAVIYRSQHVGNVVLDRLDDFLQSIRLSVYIGEPTARQSGGVGTTGIYLALHDAFSNLGIYKAWLTVHTRNFPAISVYRKLGFHVEGILRGEFWLDGQRIDAFYMGLLKEEFFKLSVLKQSEGNSHVKFNEGSQGI